MLERVQNKVIPSAKFTPPPTPLPEGRLGNIYPLGKRRGKLSQGPGQPSSSKYTTTNHNSPIIPLETPGEKFAQTDSKKHEKGRFIRDWILGYKGFNDETQWNAMLEISDTENWNVFFIVSFPLTCRKMSGKTEYSYQVLQIVPGVLAALRGWKNGICSEDTITVLPEKNQSCITFIKKSGQVRLVWEWHHCKGLF